VRVKAIAIGVVLAAGGVTAGYLARGPDRSAGPVAGADVGKPSGEVATAAPRAPSLVVTALDIQALNEDLRRVVREELARAAASHGEIATGTDEAKAAPEPSAENTRALAAASDLVRRKLAAQFWSAADASELRALMPELEVEQRNRLLAELLPAINAGKVRVDPAIDGPLY
jgi:hypothetical protein